MTILIHGEPCPHLFTHAIDSAMHGRMQKPHSDKVGPSETQNAVSRRDFLWRSGALAGAAAFALEQGTHAAEKPIQGFEKTAEDPNASKGWQPVSDRKIRVGIVG